MQMSPPAISRRNVRRSRLRASGEAAEAYATREAVLESPAIPEQLDTPKTVLVVDDVPDTRLMIRELLEWYGYRVVEAGDGSEALKVMKRERVAVLITDLYMPEMDGIQLLHQLRTQKTSCRVVAMSGIYHLGHPSTTATAGLLGADAVLNKPFTKLELFTALGFPIDGGTDRVKRF